MTKLDDLGTTDQASARMLARGKRWWIALLVVSGVVMAVVAANLLRATWNFVHGVENAYVSNTVCAPRDRTFKQARLSARGVVPRHADLARRFSSELILTGNAGQRLVLKLKLTPAVHLAEPLAAAGLSSGAELTDANLVRCFELVGKPAPASPKETELAEQAAAALITILVDSGAGPKAGPVSDRHFEVLSHESHSTDL